MMMVIVDDIILRVVVIDGFRIVIGRCGIIIGEEVVVVVVVIVNIKDIIGIVIVMKI